MDSRAIEFKIVKKNLIGNVKHVFNADKSSEYTKKANTLGLDKMFFGSGANGSSSWEMVPDAVSSRKRVYINNKLHMTIELRQKQWSSNDGGLARYKFHWCGEEFVWKQYGYKDHNFKCVHLASDQTIADFNYFTWALMDVGTLKLVPNQYLQSRGLKEFLIFSCIDLLEDSLKDGATRRKERKVNDRTRHAVNNWRYNSDSDLVRSPLLAGAARA
ncbi:hypothetical protein IWQ60_011311 [Tieghemiomyces parasiticus]|uniref:Uncharacterized protein n=1 Tax=Tieghemiomyces parasiticus TaxID=78921 RepID=A0A9W7ZHF6_9FUNG|nr:hypothetical protein IWQ60_011311 [Tieghemiomyces parasiticus]